MRLLWMALIACLTLPTTARQNTNDSPVEHMDFFQQKEEVLSKKYLSYISEVAHGGRARKMEKRREDVISSINQAITDANRLRAYKGDASLRDAYKEYWGVLRSVFTEDYYKIVDMEEIAERSYDAMEAYLLMQERARERLDEAYDKVGIAYRAFAAKNNVQLVAAKSSQLDRKLAQAGNVNRYMRQIYLIMFKSKVQETLMMDALAKNDMNAMEQTRTSMLKYAEEGLVKLDTMKSYKNDGSLSNACRKVLEFQKAEATKVVALTDFIIRKEEFEKLKKDMDSKAPSQRTQKDVDTYNKAITEFNKSVTDYNKVNDELNTTRSKVLAQYDNTRQRFMDLHAPYKL